MQFSKEKLLIVDDDSFMFKIYRGLLCKIFDEANLLYAESAKKGLDILNKEKVDLMVLDYFMPEMNGYEMILEMNKHKGLTEIPIILVSGFVVEDIQRQKIQPYIRAILNKETARYLLVPMVRQLLSKESKQFKNITDTPLGKIGSPS